MARRGDAVCCLGAAAAAGWVYLAEGGAHLVLERRAIAGDDANFAGCVLRLRKTTIKVGLDGGAEDDLESRTRSAHDTSKLTDALLWRDQPGFARDTACETPETMSLAFVENVMRPLLGSRFTDPGVYVTVDYEFLRAVAQSVTTERPKQRVDVSVIDMTQTRAVLLRDANLVDTKSHTTRLDAGDGESPNESENETFSVELKPKCGFVRDGSQFSVSRFAMHQRLKVTNGNVLQVSKYNPLDLFSTNQDDVHKALQALVAFPRNNLRIRRRSPNAQQSTMVFGEGVNAFTSLGGGEGTGSANEGSVTSTKEETLSSLLRVVQVALRESQVLPRVLSAQRKDRLGVEVLMERVKGVTDELTGELKLETRLKGELRDFVVSTVAKDCSVLIAIRRLRSGKGKAEETLALDETFVVSCPENKKGCSGDADAKYKCRVSVVDLDLKSIRNLAKWWRLERDVMQNWAGWVESGGLEGGG